MPESLERGKQLVRKLQVLQLLDNARHGMTTNELHEVVQERVGYSFSRKNIERDCKFLQEWGFPIDSHETSDPNRRKIWRLERTNYIKVLRPSDHETLNVMELLSLYAGRQLLASLAGTPFWEGIQSMWCKVEEAMPPSVWQHLDAELPLWLIRGPLEKDYSKKSGKISTLNRACSMHLETELIYQKPGVAEETTRLIHPYAIVLKGNQLVLIAIEPADDPSKYKHFKLDRVVHAKQLEKRFTPRDDFDPEDYFKYSMGVYRGSEPKTFRIRFAPSRAGWAKETPFHSKKIIEEKPDGSLVIEVEGYEEELIPRILGQGNQAEVLAPELARDRIREMTDSLAEMYAASGV